jgi:hypothetical protein
MQRRHFQSFNFSPLHATTVSQRHLRTQLYRNSPLHATALCTQQYRNSTATVLQQPLARNSPLHATYRNAIFARNGIGNSSSTAATTFFFSSSFPLDGIPSSNGSN